MSAGELHGFGSSYMLISYNSTQNHETGPCAILIAAARSTRLA